MPEISTSPKNVGDIERSIEDSLEQMHTRLVEDGALNSTLGKAFISILHHQPGLGGGVQTSSKAREGDDPMGCSGSSMGFRFACPHSRLLRGQEVSRTGPRLQSLLYPGRLSTGCSMGSDFILQQQSVKESGARGGGIDSIIVRRYRNAAEDAEERVI
jgi:hypothetical protein